MSKQETILCINSTLFPIVFLTLVFGMNISGRTIYEVVMIYVLFFKLVPIISEVIYLKFLSRNRKGGN
ncbi:hypothetical protein FKN04_22450 [Bacillus glycinifermentans]|uniref:hypothetical protein n=1 Tax=Bacillus glycinifermentans TaxID=1664069 RepID=UPI0015823912|nr:hypothetical protein [Bacillus glycinifermentans]NUJ19297.1 hypothetical protein [Bacillus glycinifermentans]